jgi:hypothetical protein
MFSGGGRAHGARRCIFWYLRDKNVTIIYAADAGVTVLAAATGW